ncbi:MAG: DUF4358 domain-containing protein [Oscillospiraceae bacterium]|nr:DUF4358 domain-containing protein [Oscillospiraceae bacterium]
MKKFIYLAMAAVMLLALAACSASGAKDTLTGTAEEILLQLKESPGVDLGMTMDDEITADKAEYALGLTAAQFAEYADSAYEVAAAISTFAQSNVLVKCKDVSAAAEVKKLIAAGFNSNKWVCVFPEQSVVVESGSYVLLAVGKADTTNALVEAFRSLSGDNIGSPNVFYTFDDGGDGDIEGGFGGDIEGGLDIDDLIVF